jgi:hypothetical protein
MHLNIMRPRVERSYYPMVLHEEVHESLNIKCIITRNLGCSSLLRVIVAKNARDDPFVGDAATLRLPSDEEFYIVIVTKSLRGWKFREESCDVHTVLCDRTDTLLQKIQALFISFSNANILFEPLL